MSDVVPGISWSPKPSCYHGDHCCLHSSHILQLFFQPSVFLKLLVFLLPDVAGCHLGLLHLSPLPSSDGSVSGPTGSWLWHSPPSERSPVLTLGLPAYTQMFLYTMPATWLWCSMYALPACILQSAVMCWMVSVAHLHSLHLGVVDVGLRQSVLCFGPAVPSHW